MSEGVTLYVESRLGNSENALRVRRVLVVKRRSANTKNATNGGILTTRDQSRCSTPSLTRTDRPSCHDWAGTMRHVSNGLVHPFHYFLSQISGEEMRDSSQIRWRDTHIYR
jgi:hypothetical protein